MKNNSEIEVAEVAE